MNCEITICADSSADLTRDLVSWMAGEPCLRGRARVIGRDPVPGALGAVTAAAAVVLESGSAATALASVVITWLRCRSGKVLLSISGTAGRPRVDLAAERVKSLDAEGVRALIAQVSAVLAVDEHDAGPLEGVGDDSA